MGYEKLSIVIPVYNEEKFIKKILDRVIQQKVKLPAKELVIVDDGSQDETVAIIKSYIKKQKPTSSLQINLIKTNNNLGKGAALKTGFLKSTGDIVVIQDADLEYNPEDYDVLLTPFLRWDADVVFGSRFISSNPHRVLYFWHYVANVLLTTFSNMLTNLNLTDMETGYKAFRGELIRNIAPKLSSKRFGFEPEITARIAKIKNIKLYEVGIGYYGRTYAEGKKIGWIDGIHAIWEIIKFNLISD